MLEILSRVADMSFEGVEMHLDLSITASGEFPEAICSERLVLCPEIRRGAQNSYLELDDSTCTTKPRTIAAPKNLPPQVLPLQILPPGPFRSLGGYLDYSAWPARDRFLELDRAMAKETNAASEARVPRIRLRFPVPEKIAHGSRRRDAVAPVMMRV